MRLQKIIEKRKVIGHFHVEAECEAVDMKISFYSHANKLVCTREVLHFASF